LAGSETIATLLPGSVFHLGSCRYAPARALIDAGAAVAIATDFNPGASPAYNMQIVMSIACTQMRMTPAEAFTAATVNGAHAVRAADRVGSLEPGKQADIVVFDAADDREISYYFGANSAILTLQKGVQVGQDHR
jgi:imidazolonepropionase